jgi:nucleoside-diphosphate-sugar epimerase
MSKKYSKILVTGGAGFIGSHLVDRLLSEGYEVKVLDDLSYGTIENLKPHLQKKEFELIKGDIREYETVKAALKDVDVVFHEAGLVSVVLSVQDPILSNSINVDGTVNLLKASVDLNVKRFVFASSAAVYAENPEKPLKVETMPVGPTNPYGVTKLVGENYARVFHKLYGLETICLRYFNVYGSRQSFSIENAYGGVITLFLNRLMKNLPPIIYGDGEQSRDFVFVKDVVQANMCALASNSINGDFFNVGSGGRATVNEVSKRLKTLLKKELENSYENARIGDVRHGYADINKANKTLNYSPTFSLEEGLAELVSWRLSHLAKS